MDLKLAHVVESCYHISRVGSAYRWVLCDFPQQVEKSVALQVTLLISR